MLQQKYPNGQQEHKKANVAAVSSAQQQPSSQKQSFAQRLVESPKKRQHQISPTCNYCGARHSCHECSELKKMPVKQRVDALQAKNLCFHCTTSGCRTRTCKDRPTCNICGKKHATLLHDREYVSKPQKSSLSPEAIDFRPFSANNDAAPAEATNPSRTVEVQQNTVL